MSIFEVIGGPITHKHLMGKTKDEIATLYMRLLRETAEGARDAARLDWLERVGFSTKDESPSDRPMGVHCWGKDRRWTAHYIGSEFKTAREAIDAAMRGGEGGE